MMMGNIFVSSFAHTTKMFVGLHNGKTFCSGWLVSQILLLSTFDINTPIYARLSYLLTLNPKILPTHPMMTVSSTQCNEIIHLSGNGRSN